MANINPRALLVLLLFFVPIIVFTQAVPVCLTQAQFAADACEEACAGCAINGYIGTTSGFTSQGNVFCDGMIVENNSVWHAFIAGSSTITITVDNFNCSDPAGLQIAIFEECAAAALVCDPGSANGASSARTVTFNATPGNFYFLLINGNNNAVCSYEISTQGVALPPIQSPLSNISGPTNICMGETWTYAVTENPVVQFYEWTAPAGSSINGTGQASLTLPASGGNQVSIEFPFTAGTGQVKVKGIGTCGQNTATVSLNVNRIFIPPTTLPPLFLYPEDLPFTWALDPSNEITAIGGYQFYTVLTSWLGCDSLVYQNIVVQPHPSGRVYWDMNNNNIYNPGIDIPAEGIEVRGGSVFNAATTDADGIFELNTMSAGTSIFIPNLPPYVLSVSPTTNTFQNNVYTNYNFALKPQKGAALGVVYIDNNNDGEFNSGDTPMNGITVTTSLGQQTTTNPDGVYQLNSVSYLETIMPVISPSFEIVTPAPLDFIPGILEYNFGVRPKSAYGQVWWDLDGDNTISAGDIPASNIQVGSSAGVTVMTNSNGNYVFTTLVAGDTIWVNVPGGSPNPAFYVVGVIPPAGYPFLIMPINSNTDLSVDLTNLTVFRPGFSTKVLITVKNNSPNFITGGELALQYPGVLLLNSTNPVASFTSSDSVHWNLGVLAPNATRIYEVSFKTPVSTNLNTPLSFIGWVYPISSDLVPSDNVDPLNVVVVGSYDPNDKQVDPAWITPAMLEAGQPLEYTIRFQNTGNYPADQVVITDSLSAQLDWSTIRVLASSHPCTWTLNSEGVLRFEFENIMLPDSFSNEAASHGFVKFVILSQGDLEVGETVANNCDIYFDFNTPIRTNTIESHIVYFLPGTDIPLGNKFFSARPNPASFGITFSWTDLTTVAGTLTLYDRNGLPVIILTVPQGVNSWYMPLPFTPDGLYMAVLESGNLLMTKRVLVVKEGPIRRE